MHQCCIYKNVATFALIYSEKRKKNKFKSQLSVDFSC